MKKTIISLILVLMLFTIPAFALPIQTDCGNPTHDCTNLVSYYQFDEDPVVVNYKKLQLLIHSKLQNEISRNCQVLPTSRFPVCTSLPINLPNQTNIIDDFFWESWIIEGLKFEGAPTFFRIVFLSMNFLSKIENMWSYNILCRPVVIQAPQQMHCLLR